MRAYTPKDNVQKKSYYNDRFWTAPHLAKEDVATDESFAKDLAAIDAKYEVKEAYIQKGQLVVVIDADDNKNVLELMKNELNYNMLSEMSCIDWIAKSGEFEVFYQMLSTTTTKRARIKMMLKQEQSIESVESLFRSANWSEREAFDMFGLKINNHPYMKRILMPDDWTGHPLLKTYPLHGDEAAQWYEVDKIFGKEYRDVIGPEIRDAARVDRYDTERFSRLGHEVPFGADISEGEPDSSLDYQEEEGVFLIEKFNKFNKVDTENSENTLKERR